MSVSSAPKPQLIRSRIEAMARAAGVGAKLPKAGDLCRELSISRRTLDFALCELERDGIIERKHAVGIFVAKRPVIDSHLLLIFHPDFFLASSHTPFWRLLIEFSRERAAQCEGSFDIHFCRAQGCQSSLSPHLEKEILSGEVAGVIGVGLREDLASFLEDHVPYVSLAGWSNHIVGFDVKSFAEQGVAQLCARGCEKIAFLGGIAPHRSHESRDSLDKNPIQEFRAALAQRDLPLRDEWHHTSFELLPEAGGAVEKSLQEQGFEAAQRLWVDSPRENWPQGLLVFDELLMQGAWSALSKAGLPGLVGREIHIVSHANAGSPTLLECQEHLDRLVYEPQQLVSLLFEVLEGLIAGNPIASLLEAQPALAVRA